MMRHWACDACGKPGSVPSGEVLTHACPLLVDLEARDGGRIERHADADRSPPWLTTDQMLMAMLMPIRTATCVAIERGWVSELEVSERMIATSVGFIGMCWVHETKP